MSSDYSPRLQVDTSFFDPKMLKDDSEDVEPEDDWFQEPSDIPYNFNEESYSMVLDKSMSAFSVHNFDLLSSVNGDNP